MRLQVLTILFMFILGGTASADEEVSLKWGKVIKCWEKKYTYLEIPLTEEEYRKEVLYCIFLTTIGEFRLPRETKRIRIPYEGPPFHCKVKFDDDSIVVYILDKSRFQKLGVGCKVGAYFQGEKTIAAPHLQEEIEEIEKLRNDN